MISLGWGRILVGPGIPVNGRKGLAKLLVRQVRAEEEGRADGLGGDLGHGATQPPLLGHLGEEAKLILGQ